MRNRNRNPRKLNDASKCSNFVPLEQICHEGESLARLLKSIQREMESARLLDRALPDKIWLKQQFSIGVNDVTRVLERMPPIAGMETSSQQPSTNCGNHKASSVQLQAILIASDCNPRWLTKHLPSLAASRNVPLIFIKDKKGGSLRLGELVKLKTAITIGIKAKGNAINQLIEELLRDNEVNFGKDCLNSTEMPGTPCQ
ncbi:hypothetical protein F0562_000698 [Nyssa sinensis]|uniref:Ribosomal protein eL8/eL30/eS12/Gadd45 domain-containing protein n=1 Tax=Nyssa sinensis TaxID=561372 RepID=A0A5J5C2E1_9ASTE|nr:hypothetical protein F0562_000698 [Nyssa sinensis]